MKYFLLILFTLFFSGCVTTKIAPKSEYRINTNLSPLKTQAKACEQNTLKIAKAFSSNMLMSHNMYYVLGETKQFAYSEALWAEDPSTIVSSEILQLLRSNGFFKNIQATKSRGKSDYLLEIELEDFMQYFNDDTTKSHVNAQITLTLIHLPTNEVYATQTFRSKKNSPTLDAQGGVKALSQALEEILLDINNWFGEVCK